MRHLAIWIGISALAAGVACTREDTTVSEKLDKLDQRMARMESQLASLATGSAAARRARPQRPRPNPQVTYAVPVNNAPTTGNPTAPVTIVEGFEFACGWCEKSRSLVKEVLDEYGDKVRLVHKNFLVHPNVAREPALAACAAHEQGKFTSLEPLIWDKAFKARKFDKAHLESLAEQAGLDMARFRKDMASPECARRVAADHQQLAKVGVSGTPAFYINGRWLPRRSKADFKRLIDEELAKAQKRIADGTAPEQYYAEWIEKKGKKAL